MIAFVYLAGPITGLGFDGATDWRVEAKNLLGARGIPTASPMRAKDYLAEMDNLADAYLDGHPLSRPAGIVARDRDDTMKAGAVIFNLAGAETVSIGTMIEIGWADAARVPIIIVHEEGGVHDHAMVRQVAGYLVDDLETAIDVATALLSDRGYLW